MNPALSSSRRESLVGLPRPLAIWIAVLAVMVIGGYPFLWPSAPVEVSDSEGYLVAASDLEDFRLEELHYRPPGYPMLLRLLGFVSHQATQRLVVVALALHMASLWMLVVVLHRLGLSRRSLGAFALVLSLPPVVEPAAYVLSENLTQFLLTATVTAMASWLRRPRWRYLSIAGAALGAVALTKPTYQLLAPVLAVTLAATAVFLHRSRPRRAVLAGGALIAFSSLPIGGFALFNAVHFDHFTISPGNLAYSLSTKTVRVLERLPDDLADVREAMIVARDRHLVERGSSHTAEQYFPSAKAAAREVTGLEGRELDALMLRLNLELIALAPLHYAAHVGQSAVSYWFPRVGRVNFGESALWHAIWVVFHFSIVGWFFLQLTVLGGVAIFEASRRLAFRRSVTRVEPELLSSRIALYLLALTVIGYTAAISCLVHHGEPRFRVPTDIQIIALCFLGGSIWRQLVHRRRDLAPATETCQDGSALAGAPEVPRS